MKFNIRENISSLLCKINIVEIIGEFINIKNVGNNYLANCPFHNDKTPSFYINIEKKYYYCFGCLSHGDVLQFIIDYKNISFFEAVKFLLLKTGHNLKLNYKNYKNYSLNFYKYVYLFNYAVEFFIYRLKINKNAIKYLYDRGISDEIIDSFKLGFSPSIDESISFFKFKGFNFDDLKNCGFVFLKSSNVFMFYNRIIFPIKNFKGNVIGFGGRIFGNYDSSKYINSSENFFFKKKKELYGIWEALSSFNYIKNIIVVEGYFDVLLLVQNDIKNVVATLGTSINKDHIDFLFTKTNEIIFCFDGDDAGKKASKKVFDICLCIINEYKKISIVFLEDGYDPDSYIRKFGKIKFLDKLCKAKDLFDYYISFLYDKYNFDHNFDNIVFYNEIKNFFDKLSNKFLKSVYYNRIINLYSDIDFSFLNENDFSKNFFSDKLFNLNK
mgnify:FL=1